jgi:alpha-ketoglutarate-dependent taurine dioxygenase
MMENAFATVRYPLSREEVSAVLADDKGLADEVRHRIQRLARQHLDGSPGYFLFAGLDGLDVAQAEVFTLALSRMLGRLLPQDASGNFLRRVTDRGARLGDGTTGSRYSESRDGGYLHTDAPHTPPPLPDYFAMYCVHQAETGGALCLVHCNDLVQRLPEWAVRILKQNFHFDRMLDTVEDPTVVRPILSLAPGDTRIFYHRGFIETAHRRPEVPDLTTDQREAMDRLDALLDDPTLQQRDRLRPGEIAFFNNRSLVHGRTAFEDRKDQKRLMLRTWIHCPASVAQRSG